MRSSVRWLAQDATEPQQLWRIYGDTGFVSDAATLKTVSSEVVRIASAPRGLGARNTNAAARLSAHTRYSIGRFYDGYRRAYTIASSLRLNEKFNASLGLQVNDISLPTGSFVSKLLTTRVNYNFNTNMFFNALVQYNSDSRQWTSNLRFNIIHRPLSDFFLVYNERRDERTGTLLGRAVIAKLTYLMAF